MKAHEACLHHIAIFLQAREYETGGALRTFVDNWFQHRVGGPFLNRNGKPIWFNNPDPKKYREALLSMHFATEDAMKIIDGRKMGNLIKDHAVPIAVLKNVLVNLDDYNTDSIEQVLIINYRLGVISRADDKCLNEAGLRSAMPPGWQVGDDPLARYHSVGFRNVLT